MRMRNHFTYILALVLLLPTLLHAQDEVVVDRVLAVVNDEIILESEVLQFTQDIVLRNRANYNTEQKIAELRDTVLEELINQKILLALAEEDTNVVVEEREVDQTLDQRIQDLQGQVGGQEALEQYYGKPIRQIRRDFRKQVRDNLLIDRLRSQKLQTVTVSKPEVEDFYRKNAGEMPDLPERMRLSHILVKIKPAEKAQEAAQMKADSIFAALLGGANFEELAMQYSDDPGSAKRGGLLGTTQRGDLVPEFEEVAFNLSEGEVAEPVKSRFGYHIIRLNWRRGEKINTSHILIGLRPSEADVQRAWTKARELYEQLQAGANFEELAREESEDQESAKLGGDLNWFDVPQMNPQFYAVAKDLPTGVVSEPFRSQLGIHLLKVTAREEPRPMDLQKDWERISRMALLDKQESFYRNWLDEKREEVYIDVLED